MKNKRRTTPLIAAILLLLTSIAAINFPAISESIEYHGNVQSYKFHRPGCRWYNCGNCTAVFHSRSEAIKAGFVPCKICDP